MSARLSQRKAAPRWERVPDRAALRTGPARYHGTLLYRGFSAANDYSMKPILHTLLGACLLASASAQTLVIPSAAANVDGNSSTSWPFDVAAGRLLYIYDSTHFTGNGINFPILISQIRFRANATTTTWIGSTATLQADLSTAPFDYTAISATFDTNHGVDRTNVYNGAWSIAAGSSTAGVPGPFYATITFTQPFLYDPTLGDLVIDTIHSGITIANTPALDAVTTAGVANAKRVSNFATPPAATGSIWSGDLANVLEFTYNPAAGLYAGFTANVTSGPSPLSVNFTDTSFSSDPNGITSYAWDLDGDNVIDSNLQNPTFVYTSCGTYTVSLTVTDGTHAPNTLTRTAYISTDGIVGSFTDTVIAPLTVQFTDTSTPAATAWAWDLNGDGIVDSNVQNPVWVYGSASPVTVTLTATRLCNTAAAVTRSIIPVQQFSHNAAPNNGLSSGASVYFDLNVLNPRGLSIAALDIFGSVVNVPFTIDMYVKHGTHRGFEGTATEWALVGTASGTSATATTLPSLASFPQAQFLPQGLHGIKLLYNGTGPRYQNLTATTTVGNGDLNLTVGVSRGSTVANPWGGANIDLRAFSGTLYYSTHNIAGLAGFGAFAPGCAGSLPVAKLTGNLPQLGSTFNLGVNNLPLSVGILMTGFGNTASAFGPLPLSLASFGAPGCFGRVSPEVTTLLIGAGNTASWSLAIPNAPAFSGLTLFNQVLALDPTANALGAVVSDAGAFQLGN